ncbi:MAG: hypothetical protein JW892_08805 [Anaerolineae bacterium]|nr:hypothetical protein [Anaerolineae bacterium]
MGDIQICLAAIAANLRRRYCNAATAMPLPQCRYRGTASASKNPQTRQRRRSPHAPATARRARLEPGVPKGELAMGPACAVPKAQFLRKQVVGSIMLMASKGCDEYRTCYH